MRQLVPDGAEEDIGSNEREQHTQPVEMMPFCCTSSVHAASNFKLVLY